MKTDSDFFNLIPHPKSITSDKGFTAVGDAFDIEFPEWIPIVEAYFEYAKADGNVFKTGCSTQVLYDVDLAVGSYRLDTTDEIKIYAKDSAGVNYAFATLWQLLSTKDGLSYVPSVTITDHPNIEYRGLMIDLARQWHPFKTLLFYVDLCWMLKINRLQLHFTDNQAYTLPSTAFPKLNIEGQFYTKNEIETLNRYAGIRGVEIIPEIDLPGHAKVFNDTYPDVFSNEVTIGVTFGADTSICVGRENIFRTIKVLIDEICELFPNSCYIHIGGDEVDLRIYDECPRCQDYIKKKGLDGTEGLYAHTVKRLAELVSNAGKTPIVWEGFSKKYAHMISKDVIVAAWESYYNLPPDLIEQGFSIINCAWKPLYIVPESSGKMTWDYLDILDWDIFTWSNFWEESPATKNPIHLPKTDKVLGAQLCAWEDNFEGEMRCIKQHLAALSERTWNSGYDIYKNAFTKRLDRLMKKIDTVLMIKSKGEQSDEIIRNKN